MYKHGKRTKQTRELSKHFRELARTAETLVSVTMSKAGLKPPPVYRRRRHVRKAIAELKAAKKAREGGE